MKSNTNNNKINAEQIRVCIRMRPLLSPYEDEEAWSVNQRESKIFSNNNTLSNTLDPMQIALGAQGGVSQANISNLIREKELRRRY